MGLTVLLFLPPLWAAEQENQEAALGDHSIDLHQYTAIIPAYVNVKVYSVMECVFSNGEHMLYKLSSLSEIFEVMQL